MDMADSRDTIEFAGCAPDQAITSGPFHVLPVEITEAILLHLPATGLGPVESCSSYFKALVLEGDLWGRKAGIVGKRALKAMQHKMDNLAEKKEDKKCEHPMHAIIAHMYKEQDKEDAAKKAHKEDADSEDDTKQSDQESEEDTNSEDDTKQSDQEGEEDTSSEDDIKQSGQENKEDADSEDDIKQSDQENEEDEEEEANFEKTKESEPEVEDMSRYFVHNRVSSQLEEEVDCGMVMCDVCLDLDAIQLNINREYKCMKCNNKTVLEDWDASIQVAWDKEAVRREKLEELLARPAKSSKEKMCLVLEFLRDTPPFPSNYFDMAVMEEGMPWDGKEAMEEEAVEDGNCVVM